MCLLTNKSALTGIKNDSAILSTPESSFMIVNNFFISFRVATIYSLAFSPDSIFLAASSNTETIHIFRLANPKEK